MRHPSATTLQALLPLATLSCRKAGDGRGPSTSSHGSQSPNHEDRLDQEERLATSKERLGREGSLPMERLDVELDRLGPLTRSMAKQVQAQVNEATDGREKTLYMLHKGPIGVLSN